VNYRGLFFIQILRAHLEVYSDIYNALFVQRTEIILLYVAANVVAIAVLLTLLRKWNIVLAETRTRTKEMEES
jgi:hypothetical protein